MLETELDSTRSPVLPDAGRLPGFLEGIVTGINRIIGIRGDKPLTLDPPRIPSTLQLESREHFPGVLISRSEKTGDRMVVFMGMSYLWNLDYLKDAAAKLLSRNAKWELGFCRALMDRGMGVEKLTWGLPLNDETIARFIDKKREPEIPSVFLFREDTAPEGQYHAISVQRKLFFDIPNYGVVSVLDHVVRAVELGYRGDGRGRDMVELALFRHGGAMVYIHKTGNPIPALINALRSEHLLFEGSHPWSSLEITDPLMAEVRKRVTKEIALSGRIILPNGVIEGDYPQPNRGFNVAELRGEALDFYHFMREQLHMRLEDDGRDEIDEEGKKSGFSSVAPLFRVGQRSEKDLELARRFIETIRASKK